MRGPEERLGRPRAQRITVPCAPRSPSWRRSSASPSRLRPPAHGSCVIEGAGEGHGVGMSQDGALGLAKHGFSDTQILAHYYSGTTIGAAPGERGRARARGLEGACACPSNATSAAWSRPRCRPAGRWPRWRPRRSPAAPTRSPPTPAARASTSTPTPAPRSTGGPPPKPHRPTPPSRPPRGRSSPTRATRRSPTSSPPPGATPKMSSTPSKAPNPQPWLQAVTDPYEGSSTHWKYTLSSATAAARLSGLFKGSLRGIEVLRRGASPRIVLAEVLGTRGDTRVSGADARVPPRPAQHLGLLRPAQRHHHRPPSPTSAATPKAPGARAPAPRARPRRRRRPRRAPPPLPRVAPRARPRPTAGTGGTSAG